LLVLFYFSSFLLFFIRARILVNLQCAQILGPPGSGKSSLMSALCGHESQFNISGTLTYNGYAISDKLFVPSKLLALIPDSDVHLPTLTVRETLKFAQLCCSDAGDDENLEAASIRRERQISALLKLLQLEGRPESTIIGDNIRRGVSGGQRKRVTIGEMMLGPQSVFFGDEVSTGLDSATTLDILNAMRIICKEFGGSFVLSLLQCSPEVSLFINQ
jgi:ABC-type multidrug transport system ATPase subunit